MIKNFSKSLFNPKYFNKSVLFFQILSMAVSMVLAMIISYLYPVDQSFWIPLSTFCVCLYISTPLTALRRTIHRIIGSIYGVIIAGSVCLIFHDPQNQIIFLVLFAGLTLWSRAFTSLYYLFVCFMTASVIILLALLMRNTNLTFDYLIYERLSFTIIGSLISLICSISIMPTLEKLDILKTYRHYLTKFYLEYKLVINTQISKIDNKKNLDSNQSIINNQNFLELNNRIYESSKTYEEKLPLWYYALFFNRFIYLSLTRYLHRIHKMRILNCILLESISKHETTALSKQYLKENLMITKKLIYSFNRLNLKNIDYYLNKLVELNDNFIKTLENDPSRQELITIILSIKELEEDFHNILHGPLLSYLKYQYKSHENKTN